MEFLGSKGCCNNGNPVLSLFCNNRNMNLSTTGTNVNMTSKGGHKEWPV